MNTTEKTEENATAQDFFKFLGALISLAFGALFFFLKLLRDSNSTDEGQGLFDKDENEFNNMASSKSGATINPMNTNNIYDD